jgi:hypothetical protein
MSYSIVLVILVQVYFSDSTACRAFCSATDVISTTLAKEIDFASESFFREVNPLMLRGLTDIPDDISDEGLHQLTITL